MKQLILGGILLAAGPTLYAQQSGISPGQQAYLAERELDETYQQLLQTCAHSPRIQKLKTEQTVWYQYRETQLDQKYPEKYNVNEKALYLAQLTRERTVELQDLYLELERAGVCIRQDEASK